MNGRIYAWFCTFVFPFVFISCSTSGPGLFAKKNLHQQYANKLESAGLAETAMGRQWITAGEQALANPVTITLPYKELSYFDAAQPRAVGLQFSGRQGEKLLFQINKKATEKFQLFADLWEVNPSAKPSFIRSIDTSQNTFELEIEDNTTAYILRLQPELLKSMDYELSISIAPSLAFPVAGGNARIASYWGADRDGGARSHEGIDIFAPRRTPALAAADGMVTRVNENDLGGLVVWMRPKGKSYNLYYAHLDEQLVKSGQQVRKGDTIGLIGNTGNARTTPPHLHLGIYASGGAVDPLPFVNPAVKNPKEPGSSINLKEDKLRLTKSTAIASQNFSNTYPANTVVQPVAVTADAYRVLLPDNRVAEVAKGNVQKLAAIRQSTLKDSAFLFAAPLESAPRKMSLPGKTSVAVLGAFNQFYFVRHKENEGWVHANALQ
ncbi:MAG: M23 family metallopeptidase [Chitinophagaceae bacterium]